MKLFQATRAYFERYGLSPNCNCFNQSIVVGSFVAIMAMVLDFMFVIRVAKTVEEFANWLYITTAIVSLDLSYAITIHKKSKLFDYFTQFDQNVATSRLTIQMKKRQFFNNFLNTRLSNLTHKIFSGTANLHTSKAIYYESNQLVEKLCRVLFFLFVNVFAPGLMLPKVVLSFFLYFNTDSRADAFDLPFPMW